MADTKNSALTEATTLANDDLFNVVDVSDTTMAATGTNKRITKANLKTTLSVADASHTHTASEITDFDTEVSNNTDVAANTAARNNATKIQNVNIDASVGTPSDGDILVYRSAGSDFVLEAKPTSSGSPAWGGITGTLASQTDLQSALDAKASASTTPTISSGAGAPASTPTKVGDVYIDTTGDNAYIAVGTASSADWEISNDGAGGGGTVDVVSNVATSSILGRVTAGSGNSEELTATQVRTLINVEDGADVTDATNVASAGAVMESDTSTASMSFVVDEDDMASNSSTKVPTQQSVKAYVDAAGGGGSSVVYAEIANMLPNFVMTTGGWASNTNGSGATLGVSAEGYFRMQSSSSFTSDSLAAYQKSDYSFIDTTYNIFNNDMRITAVIKSIQATNSPSESFFGTVDQIMSTASNIPFTKTVKHIGIYRTTGSGSSTYTASNANGTTQTSTTFTGPTNEKFASWRIDYTAGVDIKYYLNGTLMATHTTNLPSGAQTTTGTSLTIAIGNTGAQSGAANELYVSAAKLEVEA